jgi:predicted  nucleic acid-binding Zn-ribbon protein
MLWACTECTTRYAAGLAACPHCGATSYQEAPGGAVPDGAPVLPAGRAATPVAETPKAKKTKADAPEVTAAQESTT